MTYEIYRYIFLGGAILAGVMFAVSVLLFFLLKIPTVIGDLTGANARKAIENIRSQNESSGTKAHRTSHVNRERGKLTDKISPSGRIVREPPHALHGDVVTAKISTQQLAMPASETTVLAEDPVPAATETAVLSTEYANETTVLSEPAVSNAFVIEYAITYIHTDEVIAL